jgi:hypothetical protein
MLPVGVPDDVAEPRSKIVPTSLWHMMLACDTVDTICHSIKREQRALSVRGGATVSKSL